MAEIGKNIRKAVDLLCQGKLVGIPTETVYGLAGNALADESILAIYNTKNRPAFDPLIAHIGHLDSLDLIAQDIPPVAHEVMRQFWPGPVTLLLPKRPEVPDLLTSGLPRVAVRMPDHPLTLGLLQQLEFPLAAPSANPFGYVSPTSASHVNDQLGNQIDYILDGGPTRVGIESTIIGFEQQDIIVHRLGGLPVEQLATLAPTRLQLNQSSNPVAPGMLKSHYAPRIPIHIGKLDQLVKQHTDKPIGILSFSQEYPSPHPQVVLSPSGSVDEAATRLFSALRYFDTCDIQLILTEYVPDTGLGKAINDRLKRAATK
ncbi:MAG: L-threonylcarbamoyladenylate synthase [Cyclobacteriaceae bacterium]|nr:L-threonylcarbamoyladenylate synthase [Cyclobacteriaceae bacterium]